MANISLPKIPKDEFYEDWVAATLCTGGYYVDRRINLTNPTNILELDVVTSQFFRDRVSKTIVEIKSGDWGFPEIFKVRGWLDYLGFDQGAFVSLNCNKQNFLHIQREAQKINVLLSNVVIDSNQVSADEFIAQWKLPDISDHLRMCSISTLRYAFWLERQMLDKYLFPMAKGKAPRPEAVLIKRNILDVNVHIFFISDPHARLKKVFTSFTECRKLTPRTDTCINGGDLNDIDNAKLSTPSFQRLYYTVEPKKDRLHASLYSELICRLTVLKLCIEEIIKCDNLDKFIQWFETISLPSKNIQDGVEQLKKHPYYYLYPHFWQIFIYVFGGFILMSKKDEEYSLLSKLTGIPTTEVDNALSAFDILFPIPNKSWLINRPQTHIRILQFMPLPISGIGANFRRFVYSEGKEEKCNYDYLATLLPKNYTCSDLIKFNNLSVAYFE